MVQFPGSTIGFGRSRPGTWVDTVTVEVWEPGTVRVGVGPFQSFAVLNGRSNPILVGSQDGFAHYLRGVLQKAFPADDTLETQAIWQECLALADLARMIIADGHGGTVLIVPSETGVWSESLSSFAYQFVAPDTTIRDAIRLRLNEVDAQRKILERLWASDVPAEFKNLITGASSQQPWDIWRRAARAIASLAGVDGAVVMTRDLRVLGFGAKIAVGGGAPPPVHMFQPVPGSQLDPSPLEGVGGTRHQSAAQFTAANRDAVALVISQDRHLSVAHWDESIQSVVVARNAEWWV